MATPTTQTAPKPMSWLKRLYLITYNTSNAMLWAVVLGRTAQALTTAGPEAVYPAVGEWTKWTQTLAGLEIIHSVLGTSAASPQQPITPPLPPKTKQN